MRKFLAASSTLAFFLPAVAVAAPVTPAHHAEYRRLYRAVVHADGARSPGCYLGRTCHQKATDRAVVASIGVLQRILAPPAVPPIRTNLGTYSASPAAAPVSNPYTPSTSVPAKVGTNATAAASAPTTTGGYAIPAGIVQCESHGSWNAVNASSGAGGAYQIMPSTWSAYGGQGLPQDASPAEQSRIAGEIYATQGSSAWSCKG